MFVLFLNGQAPMEQNAIRICLRTWMEWSRTEGEYRTQNDNHLNGNLFLFFIKRALNKWKGRNVEKKRKSWLSRLCGCSISIHFWICENGKCSDARGMSISLDPLCRNGVWMMGEIVGLTSEISIQWMNFSALLSFGGSQRGSEGWKAKKK